jgi:hypothetical protein
MYAIARFTGQCALAILFAGLFWAVLIITP